MSVATIRPAALVDLPAIGRLGALLVRTHHDFDPERFIAATPRTEHGYASFLGSQLEPAWASRYLAIQDTGLLRTLRLHNIERHAVQLTPEDAKILLDDAIKQGTAHGAHH